MGNYIYISDSNDGWFNLAADEYLLKNVCKGDIILYFYVNSPSVIIGRNQNAWKECDLRAMERDGVRLVRRHTGGGAVYHDLGNLNFSMIMNEKDYDLQRQLRTIINAVAKLGIKASLSGRNDILVDSKKFSGNAFGLAKGNRAHHGTLLINTDLSKLQKYLRVSDEKLRSKGIDSIRSRVCELADFKEGIQVEQVRELVIESFIEEYGFAEKYSLDASACVEIAREREKQASWEWRFGRTPEFQYTIEERFTFGEMQIHFNVKDGMITDAAVYSDSLDVLLAEKVQECLLGCRFGLEPMEKRLLSLPDNAAAKELINALKRNTVIQEKR